MKNKEHGISYFAAHVTMIVSITLVLLIVGVIALIGIAAKNAGRSIREQVELSVIMQDSITDAQAQALAREMARQPFALQCRVVTRQQAMQDWQEQTGENLEEVFGVNPLSPEVCVTLRPEFTVPQKVESISRQLSGLPGVEGVAVPETETVDAMNENIETLSLVLGVVAVALICISFVLINNTVHLSIYSRRFSIHTMQLVGATNGFIRRPFIVNALLAGLISAAIACVALWCVYGYVTGGGVPMAGDVLSAPEMALVSAGLVVFSGLICGVAALIATNRYLRMRYDRLFRV